MLSSKVNYNIQNNVNEFIGQIIDLYSSEKFKEVVFYINKYLEKHPPSHQLYNILGITYNKLNNNTLAYDCYSKAINIEPSFAVSYFNLGSLFHEQNNFEHATENYKKAISLNPNYIDAIFNLAILLKENGEISKAIYTYKSLLKKDHNHIDTHYNLGVIFKEMNRFSSSIFHYKEVLKIKPIYLDTFFKLGTSYQKIKDFEKAIYYYSEECKTNKNNYMAYYLMGNAYIEKSDLKAAYQNFQKSLQVNPKFFNAIKYLGYIKQKEENHNLAIQFYYKFLKKNPSCAETNNNIGFCFEQKKQFVKALNYYKKSIKYNPVYFEAHHNMGNVLQKLGELDKARDSYEKALNICPNNSETLLNYGCANLRKGFLKIGFKMYENRLYSKEFVCKPPKKKFTWDGKKALVGKHFFIYDEQGFGDIIQFSRYLLLLKEKGAKVTFKVRKDLHKLLSTIQEDINLTSQYPNYEEIDFESPLLSLPYLLGTDIQNIPTQQRYIFANEKKITYWNKRLDNKKFKIGINWQGSKDDKSFELNNLKNIAELPKVQLISLQKGESEKDLNNIDFPITSFNGEIDNDGDAFVDTAAIIVNCDLIITCDTSIAHLSGALGKKTWILLKKIPDWRWMLSRSDTPWYKNAILFRNTNIKNWQPIFKTIYKKIKTRDI
tara:strand:+ start:89 stop:2071 length:1983 start_codon:yes stop_codon:yes gene_type:complete